MKLSAFKLKQRSPDLPLEVDFATAEGWLETQAPGSVHQALQSAGLIPDPFFGLNEHQVQWVGEVDWLYRTSFEADLSQPFADLCFDGLDTVAKVWLNGELVLETDNMFVPHHLKVRDKLRQGKNQLWILFESAFKHGQTLEAKYQKLPLWNGDSSRLYVRKAQYHYGWDWGPILLSAGVWREARLETYSARIAQVYCPISLEDDLKTAEFAVKLKLEGQLENAFVQLKLYDPEGQEIAAQTLAAKEELEHSFIIKNPQLWWPNGYGEQPLYRLEVRLAEAGKTLDSHSQKLGVRKLRLVQEPLKAGQTSFYFEVNNTPIFAGGANWIPESIPSTKASEADYRQRLSQAKAANMNMLRVWGGGIYEEDIFYDLCDELGLLVWQDFMFACGLYPAYPEFVNSVGQEAQAQVKRLRHHPSLALWCGNNEDYQLAHSIGKYKSELSPEDNPEFPARMIYERLLPEICSELDPATPYHAGSPWGGANPDDPNQGDRHTWEIWHRETYPYQDYPQKGGAFVSEFGMQAAPALSTLEAAIPPEELHPFSRTFEHHNKASDGYRRMVVYMSDNLALPGDLEGYLYASQLVQSEALSSAYRNWRRRFVAGDYACGGALVWQINDCWPVQSWAIVDSAGIPKPAYYTVRRDLAPLTVNLQPNKKGADVWAVNSQLEVVQAALELRVLSLEGQEITKTSRSVQLAPNSSTELGELEAPQDCVVAARLLDGDVVLARATLWPEPYKYLTLSDPKLQAIRLSQDQILLRADKPVKGLWLEARGVDWSDNMLELNPGDERVIEAKGLDNQALRVRYMGSRGKLLAQAVLQAASVIGEGSATRQE